MTAKECAACPGGACNSSNTACKLAPPDGSWEGWATTTQFGSGDGNWPSGSVPSMNLCNAIIGIPANADNPLIPKGQQQMGRRTMGAAIPVNYVAAGFGSRTEWVNAIIASANTPTGQTAAPVCYEIQPISAYPDQLSGGSEDWLGFCTGSDCKAVNDDSIVASYTGTDGSTTEYPSYLIIPYEFCGGNCATNFYNLNEGPDCINSCGNVQQMITNFDTVPATDVNGHPNHCDIANFMSANRWDSSKYLDEVTPLNYFGLGITAPDYGRAASARAHETAGILNWCSGQNLHFDIAQTTPLWLGGVPGDINPPPTDNTGNIAQTTADSNILVRYRRVPCNMNGQFDLTSNTMSYAGGQISTTPCYDENGVMNSLTSAVCPAVSTYCGLQTSDCATGGAAPATLVCCDGNWDSSVDNSPAHFIPDDKNTAAGQWPTYGTCQNSAGCVIDPVSGTCKNTTPGAGGCNPGFGPMSCTPAGNSWCNGCILSDAATPSCGSCSSKTTKAECVYPGSVWCGAS